MPLLKEGDENADDDILSPLYSKKDTHKRVPKLEKQESTD